MVRLTVRVRAPFGATVNFTPGNCDNVIAVAASGPRDEHAYLQLALKAVD